MVAPDATTPEASRHGRPQPEPSVPDDESASEPTGKKRKVMVYPMKFTGDASEYFRIWIVNLALSIVTLGVYTPWARVRNRQYMYGHTWVGQHNFEYTANPWALLRGYLIVVLFFGAFNAALQFQFDGWEWVVGVVLLLFVVAYPWLVRQSLKFLARSTVHRGIPFHFSGSLGGAYFAYGLANIAASFSGSLAMPWALHTQRAYQVNNVNYGTAKGNFRGDVGQFYLIALTALGLALGGCLILGILGAALGGLFAGVLDRPSEDGVPMAAIAGFVGAYFGFLLLYGPVWQYARAAMMKYVLNNVELGGVVRLSADFNPWMVLWIGLSNTVVQVFTLGLMTPWATVRMMNYVVPHVRVRAITSLDDFTAAHAPNENALGEAATELLDINLGF